MYKLIKGKTSGKIDFVINKDTGWQIPFSPDNTDYQTYLKWLEEGNTPEPADEE